MRADDLLHLEKFNESGCAATISRLIFDSSFRHHLKVETRNSTGDASRAPFPIGIRFPSTKTPFTCSYPVVLLRIREIEVASCQLP